MGLVHSGSRRVVAPVSLGLLLALAPASPAAAHHPEVVAAADCSGQVSLTAFAWQGKANDPDTPRNENELSRTNPAVEVAWSSDGRTFQVLPPRFEHRFERGNGYRFTETFALPRPLPAQVVVRVLVLEPWGSGAKPGKPRFSEPVDLSGCAPAGAAPASAPSDAPTSPDAPAPSRQSAPGPSGQSSGQSGGQAAPDRSPSDSPSGPLSGPLPWALGGAALLGGAGLLLTRPRRDRD